MAQGFTPMRAGLDDLPEGNGFRRRLGADRSTEKAVVVKDAELGEQVLSVGADFPYWEDPSLWSVLELTR